MTCVAESFLRKLPKDIPRPSISLSGDDLFIVGPKREDGKSLHVAISTSSADADVIEALTQKAASSYAESYYAEFGKL